MTPIETCRTADCTSIDTHGDDAFNGYCPSCADHLWGRVCSVCDQPVHIGPDGQTPRHTDTDGGVDREADRDHDAIDQDADTLAATA
jgi:hypothetical protein